MRIAQIARKLSVTPSEVVDFLTDNGFSVDSHHARLNDEAIQRVIDRFGPFQDQPENNPSGEQDQPASTFEPGNNDPAPDEETRSRESLPEDPRKTQTPDAVDDPSPEPELIEIPKPRLRGVKVVGRIDLPERKNKDIEDSEKTGDSNTGNEPEKSVEKKAAVSHQPEKEGRKKHTGKRGKKRYKQKKKSPLTYQEKLRLEEEKKAREKKKRKQLEKERKRQNYMKKVRQNMPDPAQRSAGKKRKPPQPEIKQRPKPQYRNPIRRLWAWLNGEYDGIY